MWFRLVAYIIYKTFETKSEALYLGSNEYNYMQILLNN